MKCLKKAVIALLWAVIIALIAADVFIFTSWFDTQRGYENISGETPLTTVPVRTAINVAPVEAAPMTAPLSMSGRTDKESCVYSAILAGLYDMSETITVDATGMEKDEVVHVLRSAIDAPEVFWVDMKECRFAVRNEENGNSTVTLLVSYSMTAEDRQELSAEVESLVQGLINSNGHDTPEEFAEVVHSWLQENVEYDHDPATQTMASRAQVTSAFVNKTAVCSGYSKAFAYAMNRAGYSAAYCIGHADESCHAWNLFVDSHGNTVMADMLRMSGLEVSDTDKDLYEVDTVRWYAAN